MEKETQREIELSLASSIQKALLPEITENVFPERDDIDIYAYIQSQTNIGGDFFDYYFIDDNHFAITVGDVSNQGLGAAIFMTIVKTCLRDITLQNYSPSEIMTKVNRLLLRNNEASDNYAAVWFGILNTATGKLTCVDAGHTPPMISRQAGNYEYLRACKNPPLAARLTTIYKQSEFTFKPNDRIFLYTNGVNESRNGDGIAFGKKLIKRYLDGCNITNAKDIINGLICELDSYQMSSKVNDDRAMMVIDFKEYHNIKAIALMKDQNSINKYGAIELTMKTDNLLNCGFEYSDIVTIKWNGKSVDMPIVPNFRYLNPGGTGLLAWPHNVMPCMAFTFCGDFCREHGINSDTEFPVYVEIHLKEHLGYFDEYVMHDLNRTDNREEFGHLSDEEFANLREVKTSGIGRNKLYRGSSPINPSIKRNKYADEALKKHGVKTAINLDNKMENVSEMGGFVGSYYSTIDYRCFNLDTNYSGERTRKKLAEIFRTLGSAQAPFYVHCIEGQDRTGFIIAVIESLMGASYREVVSEFMITYYNYYGVERGTLRYNSIKKNILHTLETAFHTFELAFIDLSDAAYQYLLELGLNDAEISAIKKNLR